MNWKVLGTSVAIAAMLTGCGGGGNTDTGNTQQQDPSANGGNGAEVEQQGYDNTGEGMRGGNNMMREDQNYHQNDQNNPRTGQNLNEPRVDVADQAAERIADGIEQVDSAYVLTTDNRAYVAAVIDNDDNNNDGNNVNNQEENEITDETREEISRIIQSVDPNIEEVYVSANPDFVDLVNGYVEDVGNGEPIEGFFDQFQNMANRLFPMNRSN